MTTPTIVPTGFDTTYKDFLKCKVDRDGCNRTQYATVTIPSGTVATTVIGLVPFQKGFRLNYGATQLYLDDVGDGSHTCSFGYAYETGSSETDDDNAFASALTTGRSGGLITFDESAGLSWVAADKGWITMTTEASTTDAEGALSGQVTGCYDGLSASN